MTAAERRLIALPLASRSDNVNSSFSPQSQNEDAALAAELERYSITSIPTMIFEWGGYRYSNASDAIAAAKRGEPK